MHAPCPKTRSQPPGVVIFPRADPRCHHDCGDVIQRESGNVSNVAIWITAWTPAGSEGGTSSTNDVLSRATAVVVAGIQDSTGVVWEGRGVGARAVSGVTSGAGFLATPMHRNVSSERAGPLTDDIREDGSCGDVSRVRLGPRGWTRQTRSKGHFRVFHTNGGSEPSIERKAPHGPWPLTTAWKTLEAIVVREGL
jgi:hypothetical protein